MLFLLLIFQKCHVNTSSYPYMSLLLILSPRSLWKLCLVSYRFSGLLRGNAHLHTFSPDYSVFDRVLTRYTIPCKIVGEMQALATLDAVLLGGSIVRMYVTGLVQR